MPMVVGTAAHRVQQEIFKQTISQIVTALQQTSMVQKGKLAA